MTQVQEHFFATKEEHIKYINSFKSAASTKSIHSSYPFLLRNLILGRPFSDGFSPITSERKLKNGLKPFGNLVEAYYTLRMQLGSSGEWENLSVDNRKKALEILNNNIDYFLKINHNG